MKVIISSDLHLGITGEVEILRLRSKIQNLRPEVLILAGDIGVCKNFDRCLELLSNLAPISALIPGNHELWIQKETDYPNERFPIRSLDLFDRILPRVARRHGWIWL